jgi:hypothetical protein
VCSSDLIESVVLEFTDTFLAAAGGADMVTVVLKVAFQRLNNQPFVFY